MPGPHDEALDDLATAVAQQTINQQRTDAPKAPTERTSPVAPSIAIAVPRSNGEKPKGSGPISFL